MGAWDSAESTDIVGLFMLSKIKKIKVNRQGVNSLKYRDDGLLVSRMTARNTDRFKKKLHELYGYYGLRLKIENCNVKIVNFLDISLNLNTGNYHPYTKPNNIIKYINTNSNHPPATIKNTVKNINNRISRNSANEEIFNASIEPYKKALSDSGYKQKLKFDKNAKNVTKSTKRKRGRRITWYNPPYALNVKTNVGAQFLRIIKECFPPRHKLHKICNKNTLKLSYRTTNNMNKILRKHNHQVLKDHHELMYPQPNADLHCNCQRSRKADCPLPNRCSVTDLVYRATITRLDTNTSATQTGCTVNFKKRYGQYLHSFKNENANHTCLCNEVWKYKKANIPYQITWDIVARAPPYNPAIGYCDLCTEEKYRIMFEPGGASLNQRSEFFAHCYHKQPQLLQNFNLSKLPNHQ